MKRLALISLMLCAFAAWAQETTYYQEAPDDWRGEVIPFPLGFAPEIPLKGLEELRFAPGMFKAEQPDYFSYTFLWWLEGKPTLSTTDLEAHLMAYYVGLYKAVSKKAEKKTDHFKVSVSQGKGGTYTGTIDWVDPFVTEKPLKLHMKIRRWRCEAQEREALFFELSPQPTSHEVWQVMGAQKAGTCD